MSDNGHHPAQVVRELVDGIDPWAMQPWETPAQHRAFGEFLGLGPDRALWKLQSIRNERQGSSNVASPKTGGRLADWSARNLWQVRAAAYDADQARRQLEEQAAEIRAMNARQAAEAQALQRVAQIPVRAILARLAEAGGDERLVDPDTPLGDLLDAVKGLGPAGIQAAKLERLARGEATERGEQSIGLELRRPTDHELDTFAGTPPALPAGDIDGETDDEPLPGR